MSKEDPESGVESDALSLKPTEFLGGMKESNTTTLLLSPEGSEKSKLEGEETEAMPCWQVRYTLALLSLIGIALMYGMRVILSIAIVAMVGSRGHHHEGNSTETEEMLLDACPAPETKNTTKDVIEGEFDWDETTQGIILGSFFWGYACTNILGGRAAEYSGGKRIFGLGIFLSAALTVITPISARTSTEFVIAVRVLSGIVQGVVFPAINSMLAAWISPSERSRYNTIVYSGFPLGTVASLPIGGYLCSSPLFGGWPSVFYLFGGLGLVWSVFWFALVYDRPEQHPRISPAERALLQSHKEDIKRAEVVALPLREIFTSLPFWGLMMGAFGYDYGFFTLLTEIPTYLKNMQHFDINQNGLLSALPFLVMWLWGYVWGSLMDYLTRTGKLTIITIRRLSMSMALYGAMLSLIVMCFVNCNSSLAVMVLCLAVGLSGSANCGFLCSHQDLAPNFAGTLLGFTNTFGSFAGVFAPMITGALTEGNQTVTAWRFVFLITVGMYLVTGTLYVCLISNRTQPWNEPKPKQNCGQSNNCNEAQVVLMPKTQSPDAES
ncbi:sialin-like [Palaemon carinicauda]|uniref:sialin-like n=1 Tax=Palaemon carinicauda TaxID=392227 RepID=UPI0035B649A6